VGAIAKELEAKQTTEHADPSTSMSSTGTTSHRGAPHFAAYRDREDNEGLTDARADVETYRSNH
jgi:hypothetical protein